MTVAELIQVLEAAKKGSVGLDRLIAETVSPAVAGRGHDFRAYDRGIAAVAVIERDAPTKAQAYTTSIDAALDLVPEGWSWNVRVLQRSDRPTPPLVRAVVFNNAVGMILSSDYCEAEAETAPIGLCIAALRARANSQKPPMPTARRDIA
jgi:hypothetical protein